MPFSFEMNGEIIFFSFVLHWNTSSCVCISFWFWFSCDLRSVQCRYEFSCSPFISASVRTEQTDKDRHSKRGKTKEGHKREKRVRKKRIHFNQGGLFCCVVQIERSFNEPSFSFSPRLNRLFYLCAEFFFYDVVLGSRFSSPVYVSVLSFLPSSIGFVCIFFYYFITSHKFQNEI